MRHTHLSRITATGGEGTGREARDVASDARSARTSSFAKERKIFLPVSEPERVPKQTNTGGRQNKAETEIAPKIIIGAGRITDGRRATSGVEKTEQHPSMNFV